MRVTYISPHAEDQYGLLVAEGSTEEEVISNIQIPPKIRVKLGKSVIEPNIHLAVLYLSAVHGYNFTEVNLKVA